MTKLSLTSLFLLLAVFSFAQGNYYDAVINLTGQPLYAGLHALIGTNTYSSYDGAKAQLFQVLENHNGYVTCIYTGYEYNVGYNYTGSTDPNTEHTYAQSWFSSPSSSIKKADLHHLFPSNSTVNSSRGNLPLYTVYNHNSANVYYTYTPWQSYRGASNSNIQVFEPADESKGNIARALLYFNTRYYDTLTQQNINMIPALVSWNNLDPPDPTEIARNQGVFNFQHNRNPFVDHPEFVNRIWGPVSADDEVAAPVASLSLDRVYPNPFRETATLALSSRASSSVRASVYNIKGQMLRSWSQTVPEGYAEMVWDGRDNQGQRLTPGVYLIRIMSPDSALTAKVLLY